LMVEVPAIVAGNDAGLRMLPLSVGEVQTYGLGGTAVPFW
jgi:hypothetical protein